MITMFVFLFAISLSCGSAMAAAGAHGFDVERYRELATETLKIVLQDGDQATVLANTQELIEMAKEGCLEHMRAPDTPDKEKQLLALLMKHADTLTSLSHDELDESWHEGGVPKTAGIDIEEFDHFSVTMSHYDAVVLPAAANILFKEYQRTGDKENLDYVADELKEAIEHTDFLVD